MPLECRIINAISVSIFNLETFIKEQTGHHFDILGQSKAGDTILIEVDGVLTSSSEEKFLRFKETGLTNHLTLSMILNGFCSEHQIVPGIYLIHIGLDY